MQEEDYYYLLQPNTDYQGSKRPLRVFGWIDPYIVKNVSPKENYIVGKNYY